MVYDELVRAMMEERDREARQIAFSATAVSHDGGIRRRLGHAVVRLGLWLNGAPSGSRSEAAALHLAKRPEAGHR